MSHDQNEVQWPFKGSGYATISISEGSYDGHHNDDFHSHSLRNDGHKISGSQGEVSYTDASQSETSRAVGPLLYPTVAPHHEAPFSASGWKPWTLRIPFLLLILLFSLALAGSIELLAQRSLRNGGLGLSNSADDMSTLIIFSYLYLPTIIAVIYSLCWAFVDLDAKRLQPFLEMSREGGASGRNSLFLNYPFEFITWIPFKALRRRHWPVFLTGLIVVLIFLLITPLQSAIMRTGAVTLTSDEVFSQIELPAVADQAIQMDLGVLNTGYSTSWLGQPLPAYTTRDYALLPAINPEGATAPGNNANITVTTTRLSTSISCWPAILSGENSVHNGKGCNYSDFSPRVSKEKPYEIAYIAYHCSPESDYCLQSPSCGIAAENQFLTLWMHWNDPPTNNSVSLSHTNMTASFCETSYSKQNVSVSLSAGNYTPYGGSIEILGPEQPLTSAEFNTTAFEYLIGNGDPILTGDVSGYENPSYLRDTTFIFRVEQYPLLADTGILWPMTPMTGFALAGQDLNLDVYSDRSKLNAIVEKAHRLFFSIVVNKLTSNKSPGDVSSPGLVIYSQYGVIVSRPFSIAVEALLLLVAILTGVLIWCCWASPSKLQRDPDSLSALIDLIRYSDDVKSLFVNRDTQSEKIMEQDLEGLQFALCNVRHGEEIVTVVRVESINREMTQYKGDGNGYRPLDPENFTTVKPWSMKLSFGVLFISVLLGVMGVIAYFKWAEKAYGGLSLPTNNEVALQILENYLPTVFATSIEPLWVLLNRLLCIQQPFKDLWGGHSPASRSIESRYTNLPPQLVSWRAIKSRHLLLAFVCMVTLVANVLTVAFGGLFNESPTIVETPVMFKQTQSSTISTASLARLTKKTTSAGNPYQDSLRVTLANLSDGTALPPWLTDDYFFLPLELNTVAQPKTESFTVETTGFTAMPSCTLLDDEAHSNLSFSISGGRLNFSLVSDDNQSVQCSTSLWDSFGQNATGSVSQEDVHNLASSGNSTSDPCLTMLLFTWNRGTGFNGTVRADTITSTRVLCQPRVASALFNVTVDVSGGVRTADQLSDFNIYPITPASTPSAQLMQRATGILQENSYPNWHNDTVSRNWPSYLLKLAGSNATNPQTTLDPTTLVPQVELMYKRTFAALLQQNPQTFDDIDSAAPLISGTQRRTETRIFMPNAAFIISVAILGLDIVAALLVYWWSTRLALPREPATIGSIIGYVAASPLATWEWKYWRMGQGTQTYSYGRYTGVDGNMHLGVNADPHVIPEGLKERAT